MYRAVNTLWVIKTIQLKLSVRIITVHYKIYTKHINALCGQKVDFLNVKTDKVI